MKETTGTIYVAYDNKPFLTAAECEAYESDNFNARFVGLTLEQVTAALNREDLVLAEAFEKAGTRISASRREAGEFKRGGRRATAEKETPANDDTATAAHPTVAAAVPAADPAVKEPEKTGDYTEFAIAGE